MYLLNLEIISTKTYHADTSIFVHNISIYKFKDELFVNKDHKHPTNHMLTNFKIMLEIMQILKIRNCQDNWVLRQQETMKFWNVSQKLEHIIYAHCLFIGIKPNIIAIRASKYKKQRSLKEKKDGNILYKKQRIQSDMSISKSDC